jgi:hypothetical protein
MSEMMQKVLDEIQKLDENRQEILANYMLHVLETEEYLDDDDESDVEAILNPFVDENGDVNFQLLKSRGTIMTLDELKGKN